MKNIAITSNLSVCIIAKNEEKNIEKCLQALSEFPFEIVVVDTGSTDRTAEIAREYTQEVHFFTWCDDFSAAKNFAIEKASNDMVLVLDSDEYIEHKNPDEIQKLLEAVEKEKNMVGRIKRRNFFSENGEARENQEWVNRIFSRKRYHYEGRIHEQVTALDGKEYGTYLTSIVISHSGYDLSKEEKKEKGERNKKLLLKELACAEEQEQAQKDRQIPYLLYQLGKSCFLEEQYEEACDYFAQGLSFDLNPKAEYVIDMVESYGYALLNSGQEREALFFTNIYTEFSQSADFLFLMGLIYMKNAQFEESELEFQKAIKNKNAKMKGTNSYLAYYNMGVMKECLGNTAEAISCYNRGGEYDRAKARLALLQK